MIKDNNTITIFSLNGHHEEYVLDPTETGLVLPGSVVALFYDNPASPPTGFSPYTYVTAKNHAARITNKPLTDFPGDDTTEKQAAKDAAAAAALDTVELLIVKENALVGGSINRPSETGETILVQRAVSGDRYLVRVIEGTYEPGDPLYLKYTPNGIYFTKVQGSAPTVRAITLEPFTVDNTMVDKTDRSNTDGTGKNEVANGSLVNLLRVRIA
jgi:hypothetical protein